MSVTHTLCVYQICHGRCVKDGMGVVFCQAWSESQWTILMGYYLNNTAIWLWSPYVIGQTIFLPCDFYLSFFFLFFSPNLSGRRLDVYHTSTHGVALVRI